jgi:acetylornithine deacetylase/succinyl-diaminopimelate desuccinylase-like protein
MFSIQTGRSILTVAALSGVVLAASALPARADNPVESLREGAVKAVEALRALAEEVQRYGVPYFDKDGNIVIPRSGQAEDRPDAGSGKGKDNGTVAL